MSRQDFDADMDEMLKLALELDKVRTQAIPHATRNSLNESAFLGRFTWQGAIRTKLITRNRFTERRIGVNKARGTNLPTMEAVLGHTERYMRTQEDGGIDRGAVPMPAASGEKTKPRLRLVRRANAMKAISLAMRGRKGSKRQRNAASIRIARKAGRKFVFLHTERTKGIFRMRGGKRKVKFDMIWNLKTKSRFIKPTPTLEPTIQFINPKLPRLHIKSLKFQLRRLRLMGF